MLIGLSGQAGSGKDTVYERAKLKYPEAKRIGFADKLKQSAAALLNLTVDDLNEMKNEPDCCIMIFSGADAIDALSIREFLQRYGTESHRDVFGEDFWVEQALRDYDGETLTFVTDCRFVNEVEAIRARGGQIWRVKGPDFNPNPTHPSEQILPNELIDVELDNTRRDDNFKTLDAWIEFLLTNPPVGVTAHEYI